ncbi:uncharacterized protein PHACADRAFT_203692 [Phanerochaete carnosa HHB-10118-sp]|uniref:Nephrocystin 3-like N-terminal domain-containing protein n=1 Tax=Phanerochaete carnosa (strain HHB-10118-sp) TaxID=650164 RepID=K5WMS1_PHACS|nr:uncharacterized protein PHACADRAFT_203692 [Phanerochaete carnosa HHB-10118-sp]EKM60504.1 hypothetical protein PHACADRAFT_203692 [Phanerochaete carnosa HHB-10118-sp]
MPPHKAIDVVLDAVPPILELVGDALEAVSVPGLPLIAKGLNLLIERVIVIRKNKEARNAFLAQTNELKIVINTTAVKVNAIVAGYDGDAQDKEELKEKIKHSDDLQKRIRDLQSTIDDLRGRAGELKGGKGFRGSIKGFVYGSWNQAILSDMKDEMKRALERFKLAGSISIESIVDSVAQTTKRIQRQLREAEDQKIIDSIPRADAGYRSVDELKSGFMQGTRKELFVELEQWSTGRFPEDKPKRFYYLGGGAGLGKSSIAHQLCVRYGTAEHLSLRLGASYFFVRGRGDLEDARLVFSTLARQLAVSQPTLRPHIISAAREYLNHGDRQQMQHAFEGLLRKALTAASADQVPILLVIDGVDECKDRNLVPSLLQSLLALVRELPWLYVFVASRPEPHILSVVAPSGSADIVHHMRLEDTLEDWGDDVKFYLEETVPKIPTYGDFLDKHPGSLERLIRRAAGVFIFARIVVNFLDMHRNHPEEWFELVLSGGGPAMSPLDALYLQILRSAFPPEDLRASPPEHKRLLSFLRFVVLESHRVNPETIAFYERDLSFDDVFYIADRLRSVLMIDKAGDLVPLHASFGEFLVDEHRCSDALYRVDKSEGHAHLACACLAAMSFENRTYYLQDAPPQHTRVNFGVMVDSWWKHVKQAKYTVELEEQLSGFVQDTRLVLHMWIYTEFRPEFNNYSVRYIWDCLQPSGARKVICSEFLKFGIYIKLWQLGVLTSPSRTPPEIISDDISQAIQRLPHNHQELLPGLDLAVDNSRLTQYQAIMANFMTQINRDEATKELWCKDFYVNEEHTCLIGQDSNRSQPSASLPVTTSSSSSTTSVTQEMISALIPDGSTVLSSGNGGLASDAADTGNIPLPIDPPGGGLLG